MQDMPFKVLHICILLFRFCIRATAQPEPDIYTGNAEEATNLWESAGCELQPTFTGALMPYLGHRSEDVRGAAAEALAAGLQVRLARTKTLQVATRVCWKHRRSGRARQRRLSTCIRCHHRMQSLPMQNAAVAMRQF